MNLVLSTTMMSFFIDVELTFRDFEKDSPILPSVGGGVNFATLRTKSNTFRCP